MVQLIQTKMNLELNHVNLPIPYLHLLGFRLPFVFEKKDCLSDKDHFNFSTTEFQRPLSHRINFGHMIHKFKRCLLYAA